MYGLSYRIFDVLLEFNGAKIHHLGNGLTMNEELHSMFDDLSLWFEEIAVNAPSIAFSNAL